MEMCFGDTSYVAHSAHSVQIWQMFLPMYHRPSKIACDIILIFTKTCSIINSGHTYINSIPVARLVHNFQPLAITKTFFYIRIFSFSSGIPQVPVRFLQDSTLTVQASDMVMASVKNHQSVVILK